MSYTNSQTCGKFDRVRMLWVDIWSGIPEWVRIRNELKSIISGGVPSLFRVLFVFYY